MNLILIYYIVITRYAKAAKKEMTIPELIFLKVTHVTDYYGVVYHIFSRDDMCSGIERVTINLSVIIHIETLSHTRVVPFS